LSQDAKVYEERGACIAEQYTQEIPEAGVKQDGHLTQGEDTADNGGIRLALMARHTVLRFLTKALGICILGTFASAGTTLDTFDRERDEFAVPPSRPRHNFVDKWVHSQRIGAGLIGAGLDSDLRVALRCANLQGW